MEKSFIKNGDLISLENKYHQGTYLSSCDGAIHHCMHNVTLDSWDDDATIFKIMKIEGND